MNIFKFAEILKIKDDNKDFIGISNYPDILKDLDGNSNLFGVHKIASNEEYRPDKISNNLYQNPDLSWVLDVVNDFEHGISEYYVNRIIIYPVIGALSKLGIL